MSRADVARYAGVSHGTVSHVLNHPDRVRPETRERVEAAIDQLGFIRDEAARHLRAGYSTTIGLMLLDAWNPSFIDIARGVDDRTAGGPWTVLMSNSARDTARERRYLHEYSARRVAGLLVIPNDKVGEADHALPHDSVPLVLIDRAGSGAGMSVAVDDGLGGRLVADHLADLGHRRIAFVGDPGAALPVQARFAGFEQRLGERFEKVDLEVIPAPLTISGGVDVGRALADRPPSQRPTAVAAAVDLLAFGIMQTLQARGLSIPRDLSIVGYDDIWFTSQLSVSMTTIARPHYLMGTTAADLLLRSIEGAEPDERHLVLEPELVVRGSTGPPH